MTSFWQLGPTPAQIIQWDAEDRTAPVDPEHPREAVEARDEAERHYDRGYQPMVCECGHPVGDHNNRGTGLGVVSSPGICFVCDCRGFQEMKT